MLLLASTAHLGYECMDGWMKKILLKRQKYQYHHQKLGSAEGGGASLLPPKYAPACRYVSSK